MLEMLLVAVLSQCGAGPSTDEMGMAGKWRTEHHLQDAPSYSFVCDGEPSTTVLPRWLDLDESGVTRSVLPRIDPKTGLEVRCEAAWYSDFPAVEWVLSFRNTGAQDSPMIEDIQALRMSFASPEGDPVLHFAKGATCSMDDFMPLSRTMNPGAHERFQPGGGRSSSDFLPFFNLEHGGGGVIVGVGWSGEWAASFERDKDSKDTRLVAGMDLTHLRLHPGEEIRTPRILLLFYQGDWQHGQNQLRRFILKYARPNVEGKPMAPSFFASNWGGTPIAYHMEDTDAIISHDLPTDFYWIDAEWFGTGKWHQTAGDWRVKKELYPEGFKPLSDRLHAAGRKLLLWFEPERVCEGTPWYTEHADWLLEVPKEKRHYNWGTSQAEPDWVTWESLRNQIRENDRLFNLGNPEACKFLTDYMSARIDEFGLDCFRHDANIAPLEFWRAADTPDRQGITEIRWVEGLYAFWDGLLQRHPNLIIDNCASGGRRIDLESLRRATPLWRTDHPQDIAGRQCHTYGISHWIPLNATGCDGRDVPYSLRSTYSSIMDVGLFAHGDAAQPKGIPTDYPYDRVKAALQEYRDVQQYFLGDYYPLSQYSQASDAWMAWQFDRPDLGEGLVQAFRRPDSLCESATLPLRGLDPDARYTISNRDMPETTVLTGKDLMEKGITVTAPQKPAALVLTYHREP